MNFLKTISISTVAAFTMVAGVGAVILSLSSAEVGPEDCKSVGDTCDDGSTYAGRSPDDGGPIFTPSDRLSGDFSWRATSHSIPGERGAECEIFPSLTGDIWSRACYSGEENTSLLVSLSETAFPAANYCAGLIAHGRDDWYLPAIKELEVLYKNKYSIGELGQSEWYWSSSTASVGFARVHKFADGYDDTLGIAIFKEKNALVQCIRSP